MGKHIIRISRLSCRSLFMAYSRLMTMIFALFCAATGQLPKNTSVKRSELAPTVFKGTAYRASDSTVLGGIKLFLQECYAPLYGIIPEYGVITPYYGVIAPEYGVVITPPTSSVTGSISRSDTIITDENGHFETNLSSSGDLGRFIISEEVTEPSGRTIYSLSDCVYIKEGTDSTYTLYLNKTTTTVGRAATSTRQPSVMTVYHGNELQIRIPEWRGRSTVASIVNSRGQEAASVTSAYDGTFHWNTHNVAKGIYFFRFHDDQTRHTVRILVK